MKLNVNLTDKNYDIIIEDNLLNDIKKYLDVAKRYFIITDSGVPEIYLKTLLNQLPNCDYYIIPQGEKSKNFDNYKILLGELLKKGYSRKDNVIALGGGVVGDLSGFVAATFKRGLHFINIPTTSLSMVDSSIGGKVAIDFDNIKNAVGAFYQPDIVLIDPLTLKTLPTRHIYNGLIEAIKTGLIADEKLFEIFKKDNYLENIHEIIYRSLDVKRYVVEKDEKEQNLRKILNYGHTFGHAYESYFDMEKYLHGESVALGMLVVGRKELFYNDLLKIVKGMGIDVNPKVDNEKLLSFIANDKKTSNGKVDMLLVHKIGTCEIVPTELKNLPKFLED